VYQVEDRKFSSSFKDITTHIKSLRVDAVLGAGLNISRRYALFAELGTNLFMARQMEQI
jgi:RNA-binding protein YlmH